MTINRAAHFCSFHTHGSGPQPTWAGVRSRLLTESEKRTEETVAIQRPVGNLTSPAFKSPFKNPYIKTTTVLARMWGNGNCAHASGVWMVRQLCRQNGRQLGGLLSPASAASCCDTPSPHQAPRGLLPGSHGGLTAQPHSRSPSLFYFLLGCSLSHTAGFSTS